MQSPRRRFVRGTTLAALFVAAGAIALACSVQSDAPTIAASKAAAPSRAPQTVGSSYAEFQVEKQAAPMPGNAAPRYPDALRTARVEGRVIAQFVVNADGTPDMRTFKVLKSSDPQFTNAVHQSLATWKFYPARVGDRAVRQLVTTPFVFALSRCDSCKSSRVRSP